MIGRTPTPQHRAERTALMPACGWISEGREKALRQGLRDLPDLGAQAAVTITAERLSDGVRGVPGSRPPIQLAAIDLVASRPDPHAIADPIGEADLAYRIGTRRQPIRAALESWCWLAHDELRDDGKDPATPTAGTVSAACAWLLRHIVWILDQQWVEELALDVTLMVRECRAVLRERPVYRPRCVSEGCRSILDAHVGWWSCPACGRDYRDDRMVMSLQQPMTAEQIAKAFGLPSATIRKWRERGHLEPAEDGHRPRYHVNDVLRLADDRGLTG